MWTSSQEAVSLSNLWTGSAVASDGIKYLYLDGSSYLVNGSNMAAGGGASNLHAIDNNGDIFDRSGALVYSPGISRVYEGAVSDATTSMFWNRTDGAFLVNASGITYIADLKPVGGCLGSDGVFYLLDGLTGNLYSITTSGVATSVLTPPLTRATAVIVLADYIYVAGSNVVGCYDKGTTTWTFATATNTVLSIAWRGDVWAVTDTGVEVLTTWSSTNPSTSSLAPTTSSVASLVTTSTTITGSTFTFPIVSFEVVHYAGVLYRCARFEISYGSSFPATSGTLSWGGVICSVNLVPGTRVELLLAKTGTWSSLNYLTSPTILASSILRSTSAPSSKTIWNQLTPADVKDLVACTLSNRWTLTWSGGPTYSSPTTSPVTFTLGSITDLKIDGVSVSPTVSLSVGPHSVSGYRNDFQVFSSSIFVTGSTLSLLATSFVHTIQNHGFYQAKDTFYFEVPIGGQLQVDATLVLLNGTKTRLSTSIPVDGGGSSISKATLNSNLACCLARCTYNDTVSFVFTLV